MILYIQHIDIEGPDTLGEFFSSKGFVSKVVRLNHNEALPKTLDAIDAVVVLGGPMNVDEEDIYPFLKEENRFIQKVLQKQIPYFGLCLGSQLLAKAAGAKVVKSPAPEIGFSTIQLTHHAVKDPVFKDLEKELEIYQWHGDMWHLPKTGTLLAGSSVCPHQAFRVGNNAYGLQFHVEITENSINDWCDAYLKEPERTEQKNQMFKRYKSIKKSFQQTANTIYNNFLGVIASEAKQSKH